MEKEVTGIDKMGKNIQNIYSTDYSVLIAQDLWQAHDQILSITFLKDFLNLNVNMETTITKVKLAELNVNIAYVFLNT